MKKIKVTEKSGASIEYINDGEVISRLHLMGHGKPERWVLHKDDPGAAVYDDSDVLQEETRELSPAIPATTELVEPAIDAKAAVLDADGNIIKPAAEAKAAVYRDIPAIPAVIQKWVKLRAEYSIEVLDITAEYELSQCLSKRRSEYPSSEDFMNAYFDEGEAGLLKLKQKRLAIKAKYPKPSVS